MEADGFGAGPAPIGCQHSMKAGRSAQSPIGNSIAGSPPLTPSRLEYPLRLELQYPKGAIAPEGQFEAARLEAMELVGGLMGTMEPG